MKVVWDVSLVLSVVCFLISGVAWAAEGGAAVGIERLEVEYLTNPVGIDAQRPRLSWVVTSDERGQGQTAYRVLVAGSKEALEQDRGDLWDSGKVASSETTNIEYAGKALASWQPCWWKVRVWDRIGQGSAWSEPARWSMGVLNAGDWKGKWLGYSEPRTPTEADQKHGKWQQKSPSPLLRREFALDKPVRSAMAAVCGLGYHELYINGEKVSDHLLDPPFTRYDRSCLYVTHDVTDQVREGDNAIGVMLGNGWYNMHTHSEWDFDKAPWRDEPKVLLQMHVVYEDGTTETISTDERWKAATGPILLDGIRHGEVYDARKETPGWDTAEFDDSGWHKPAVVKAPGGELRAMTMPPIRVTETIRPVKIHEPAKDVYVYDMGQNFSGVAQLKLEAPAGTRITLRYGERITEDGNVSRKGIDQFRKEGPFQTDMYICKGEGEEVWHPRFTYHGFQYVEVTGLPEKPGLDNLLGLVLHTDFESAGQFECSNELLNTIQRLTRWAYRSNYHGYPTDCPQREKNGWTGDAHLAAEQAMYNWRNAASYTKWMMDFHDEQRDSGELPGIVPTSGWGYAWGNGPAWDSAYIIIPWYMQQYLGDTRILETHFDRFKRYVDYLTSKANGHIVSIGLGDWVPAETKTPTEVTSTGFYYADALITGIIAARLGRMEDSQKYLELARQIRQAWHEKFYQGDGVYANGSQTALSFALYGLAPESEMAAVAAKLVENVRARGHRIDTGILGAKLVFNVLSDNGYHEDAYKMATQTKRPSYGNWIAKGATTLWEDWGGDQSLNHIMFGDISAWFYKYLAGIRLDPRRPAFERFTIRPMPAGDLQWVRAWTDTVRGRVGSEWRIADGRFTLSVQAPVGSTAEVYVPCSDAAAVRESGVKAGEAQSVEFLRTEDGCAVYHVGSGRYCFEAPYDGK